MKQLRWLLGIAVLTMAASSVAIAQSKDNKMGNKAGQAAVEEQLIALDRKWTAAELRLNDEDKQTISMIVADNFADTTPEGQLLNKTQYLAGLKHTDDTDVADEYHVSFFDNGKLAVMTHRGVVNGKPTYRSTHVWMKQGNNWQLIQNHTSNISAPSAP
jgi:hypothetical protein